MKTKQRSSIITIAAALMIVLSFSACTTQQRANRQPLQPDTTQMRENRMGINRADRGGQLIGAKPQPIRQDQQLIQSQMLTDKQKADKISSQLVKMNEISKVNVLVNGNTAIIGYMPSTASKDSITTKNMILRKVKEIDRSITNVAVSDSTEIMNRVNRLSDDIMNNTPMDKVNNDFSRLLQEITPSVG